jgi:ATP-dependent helicase HepA
MTEFKTGQKWISNAEPELGIGSIIRVEHRHVGCYFQLAGEERTYSRLEAPLTRVKFNPGDEIQTLDGITLLVTSMVDREGIFIYHGDYQGTNTAVIETELDPNVRFSKPQERLFTHQLDDNRWFNLRYRTLQHVARLSESGSRGLYGPRVSLIPHQLYIANEVASRFAPRVLLADEVGLGKTIEAGLIIHQQLQTGRARRVLIIVPPALTFQWFVEMIRRFNLQFTVLDEERCQQIVADNVPEFEEDENELENPFEAQQLALCSLDLFTENSGRLLQAMDSEWDLVVVDEAHHLKWTPESSSNEYLVVEQLSHASTGLLLLTATPEQLGRAGHFARLRLLDPVRYHEYEAFLAEESAFEGIASAVVELLDGEEREKNTARLKIMELLGIKDTRTDDQLISILLDRHGTGRVLFRNVRSSVEGFSRRITQSTALESPVIYKDVKGYFPETEFRNWVESDPRISWLIDLVSDSNEKFLIICAHQQTAVALEQFLKNNTVIRTTVFHEGMDLIARDRSASYFSETYKGAQLMVCSEIGSEGRNFQFSSHLVLFDLPLSPDLLEQRIGRLDRIGQLNDVILHIPTLSGFKSGDLFRWFDEGMDLFSEPNPVGQSVFDDLIEEFSTTTELDSFIVTSQQINAERRESITKGRDRLLELHSHRPTISSQIVADIQHHQGGQPLEEYMEMSFEMFGLESEPLGDGVHGVKPTETMIRNTSISLETQGHYHYPELPEDGISITYDRDTALAREDTGFFTWENPMVQQALDVVLTDVTGNSTMIAIKNPAIKAGTLLLEVLHVVDCVAPAEITADRYLPPLISRSMISAGLKDISEQVPFNEFTDTLDIPPATFHKILESELDNIKEMLNVAETKASNELGHLIESASHEMNDSLDLEIERLEQLMKVNESVRPEELEFLILRKQLLSAAISSASMRLDAVRLIVCA